MTTNAYMDEKKSSLDKNLFATLCFNVLMATNDGWKGKSPGYVQEKSAMLNEGYDAYGFLDRNNQIKLMGYLKLWKVELPEEIQEYETEYSESAKTIEEPR